MKNKKFGYGFYFRCIQGQIEKYVNENMKEYNLTKSQLDVLRYLDQNKDRPIFQKDIEDFFHISNPTVTGLLNRLEEKGYIIRKKSDKDKRIHLIERTRKADIMKENYAKNIQVLEKRIAAGLSPEEKEQLFVLLSKVIQNLIEEEEKNND